MNCELCNKSFKNLKLHQSKAHSKDMWKIVIPHDFNENTQEIKVYCYGKFQGKGWNETYTYYEDMEYKDFYVGIESQNTIKTELMIVQIPVPFDIDKVKIKYSIELKYKYCDWIPVDKLNYTIEIEKKPKKIIRVKVSV